jgi:ABC-type transporter Mla MlaB component
VLKITTTLESPREVQLLLEGKVAEQWAALLDGVCRNHLRKHQAVQLDCERVDFVDARGVDVLKSLPRRQLKLVRVPEFLTLLLHEGVMP